MAPSEGISVHVERGEERAESADSSALHPVGHPIGHHPIGLYTAAACAAIFAALGFARDSHGEYHPDEDVDMANRDSDIRDPACDYDPQNGQAGGLYPYRERGSISEFLLPRIAAAARKILGPFIDDADSLIRSLVRLNSMGEKTDCDFDFRHVLIYVVSGERLRYACPPYCDWQQCHSSEERRYTDGLTGMKAKFLAQFTSVQRARDLAEKYREFFDYLPKIFQDEIVRRFINPGLLAFQEAVKEYSKYRQIIGHHEAWAKEVTALKPAPAACKKTGDDGLHREYAARYGWNADDFNGSVAWWMRLIFDMEKRGIPLRDLQDIMKSELGDISAADDRGQDAKGPIRKKFKLKDKRPGS